MNIDEETGEPSNPEYYDCVVNKLLREFVIRGCTEYNEGYIGGIKKNEDGHYRIALTELDDIGKEELAAVILYSQQQKNKNFKNGKNEEVR